jgi:hypothetical protein
MYIVNDYFRKLREVMTKMGVMDKPHLLFVIDEKECQLTLHKSQEVFPCEGINRVPFVAPEHPESAGRQPSSKSKRIYDK